MSIRGKPVLSRMLLTFCDYGGSSKGMMEYLERSGDKLKATVEGMGGQIVVEVRRNHHPEIRTCNYKGLHLSVAAESARRRHALLTSDARWRKPPTTARRRTRTEAFRMKDIAGEATQNPAVERAVLRQRMLNVDTEAGRTANYAEINHEFAPDRPGDGYSLPLLMEAQGSLPHPPFDWPVYKVWGPSSKVVNARNLSAERIDEHFWWLLRTIGQRSTAWGNNVRRHTVTRLSVQGAWTPVTAALLQSKRPFQIHEVVPPAVAPAEGSTPVSTEAPLESIASTQPGGSTRSGHTETVS